MRYCLFFFLVFTMACQEINTPGVHTFSDIQTSSVFAYAQETGVIHSDFVKELSGLAASRRNPGAYWVHNDGKKVTEIFLIDSLGNRLATCLLSGITSTQDCEDIEIGPGPEPGVTYIYLADTGDNNGVFDTHPIYRFPEPVFSEGNPNMTASGIVKLVFQYPESKRLNAESLLLDPVTRDLYVFTKAVGGGDLFRFPYPQSETSVTMLEHVVELPIEKATAGDISPDGTEVLLKNKKEIFYWKAQPGESVRDLLSKTDPQRIPYAPEIQGEAICFNAGATGFLTSTELAKASGQPIYYFGRNK